MAHSELYPTSSEPSPKGHASSTGVPRRRTPPRPPPPQRPGINADDKVTHSDFHSLNMFLAISIVLLNHK